MSVPVFMVDGTSMVASEILLSPNEMGFSLILPIDLGSALDDTTI